MSNKIIDFIKTIGPKHTVSKGKKIGSKIVVSVQKIFNTSSHVSTLSAQNIQHSSNHHSDNAQQTKKTLEKMDINKSHPISREYLANNIKEYIAYLDDKVQQFQQADIDHQALILIIEGPIKKQLNELLSEITDPFESRNEANLDKLSHIFNFQKNTADEMIAESQNKAKKPGRSDNDQDMSESNHLFKSKGDSVKASSVEKNTPDQVISESENEVKETGGSDNVQDMSAENHSDLRTQVNQEEQNKTTSGPRKSEKRKFSRMVYRLVHGLKNESSQPVKSLVPKFLHTNKKIQNPHAPSKKTNKKGNLVHQQIKIITPSQKPDFAPKIGLPAIQSLCEHIKELTQDNPDQVGKCFRETHSNKQKVDELLENLVKSNQIDFKEDLNPMTVIHTIKALLEKFTVLTDVISKNHQEMERFKELVNKIDDPNNIQKCHQYYDDYFYCVDSASEDDMQKKYATISDLYRFLFTQADGKKNTDPLNASVLSTCNNFNPQFR